MYFFFENVQKKRFRTVPKPLLSNFSLYLLFALLNYLFSAAVHLILFDGLAGKQFVERYDAVAFGFEVADDLRDGFDGRFMDVVRQNDGIGRCFRHFGRHSFGIAVFPVERVDVPTDNGTIRERQFIVGKGSVREAEIGRLAARNLLSDVVGERYLAAGFVERYFGKVLMVVRMVFRCCAPLRLYAAGFVSVRRPTCRGRRTWLLRSPLGGCRAGGRYKPTDRRRR